MRYYVIAGEASGDLHGSNLVKALKKMDDKASFRGFGGDLMESCGVHLVKHYREMAFMGFVNVLLNIRTIKANMDFCKEDLVAFSPDALILIDYPGFNLKIAEFARRHSIPVFYYIPPKLWAWKEYRVKKIRAFVDEVFTIFPFETAFYAKHGIRVNYVGNPLLDAIHDFRGRKPSEQEFRKKNGLDDRPVIALLAGSRVQEIKAILPVMRRAVDGLTDFQVVLAGVQSVDKELYQKEIRGSNIRLIYNQTYDLLECAHTALVASGTAALETALFEVPQTVLYKVEGGVVLHYLMSFILKIKWVSLPNIILGRMAVKELLQKDMTLNKVKAELMRLLTDVDYRNQMKASYGELKQMLGKPGCSERAARQMKSWLDQHYRKQK